MTDPRIPRSELADADPDDPLDGALTLAIETGEHLQACAAQRTGGQRLLAHVNWVLSTQANGGLTMTVLDSPYPPGPVAAALEAIGASTQAELVRHAAAALAQDETADVSALDNDWEARDLDTDLATRMLAYSEQHPGEFFSG